MPLSVPLQPVKPIRSDPSRAETSHANQSEPSRAKPGRCLAVPALTYRRAEPSGVGERCLRHDSLQSGFSIPGWTVGGGSSGGPSTAGPLIRYAGRWQLPRLIGDIRLLSAGLSRALRALRGGISK